MLFYLEQKSFARVMLARTWPILDLFSRGENAHNNQHTVGANWTTATRICGRRAGNKQTNKISLLVKSMDYLSILLFYTYLER